MCAVINTTGDSPVEIKREKAYKPGYIKWEKLGVPIGTVKEYMYGGV